MNKRNISYLSLILIILGIAAVFIGDYNREINKLYFIGSGDVLLLAGLILSFIAIKEKVSWISLIVLFAVFGYSFYEYYSNRGPTGKEMLDKFNNDHR